MSDFSIKQGDLLPVIQATLAVGGTPVDLTGATVTFAMSVAAGGPTTVNAAASVVDAVGGVVAYDWKTGDTDTTGAFEAEWKVVDANGKPQRFPTVGYHSIDIEENLGEP